jgi:hypothetical protein
MFNCDPWSPLGKYVGKWNKRSHDGLTQCKMFTILFSSHQIQIVSQLRIDPQTYIVC